MILSDDPDHQLCAGSGDSELGYDNPVRVASSSDEDSSRSTSSSDADDDNVPVDELRNRGWLAEQSRHENVIALANAPKPPVFGNANIEGSSNVHLGNRTIYRAPVTIKQFVYSSSNREEATATNQNIQAVERGRNDVINGKPTTNEAVAPEKEKWFKSRRLWVNFGKGVAAAVTILLLLIGSFGLLTILRIIRNDRGSGVGPVTPPPISPNDSSITNDPAISGFLVVPRVMWGAQPPNKAPTKLKVRPPIYVIISHTATDHCYTQSECVLIVRVAQSFHVESRGWNDISYNFLVGGDGLVYQGRGWDIEGAHTYNYNNRSIGISFIGTFKYNTPTKAQVHAARKLISWGVVNGKIDENYKLLGHRQCSKTESPGNELYNIIRTWEHWSPRP